MLTAGLRAAVCGGAFAVRCVRGVAVCVRSAHLWCGREGAGREGQGVTIVHALQMQCQARIALTCRM